jgi:L-asparaginase II
MTTVVFTRGGLAESVHDVAWCATGPGGEIAATGGRGARDLSTFPRSAAKPLQALPAVRAGVLERFGLDDRHLALACASHGGGPEHLERVSEVLAACGQGESALRCGPIMPRDPSTADELTARGGGPAAIHNNCSGKHALALALCVAEGWPVEGYTQPEHPVQQAMRRAVGEAAGVAPEALLAGVDGCGFPTFHLPLAALAHAFARLAGGGLGDAGERVARAMRRHPRLVAYAGAVDAELMAAEDGLVAKIGAEGVIAIGADDGRAIALKVLDGAMRALDPAAVAAVRGLLRRAADAPPLRALEAPWVRNTRGEVVGRLVAG